MRSWGTMLVLLVAVFAITATAAAAPRDTTVRTIQDTDGDNLLEFAPGEKHCVFALTLTPPSECLTGSIGSPTSILNFLQLSDFQAVDEESPGRVEAVDSTQRAPGSPFSAAYRPQETLSTQVTEAMVRQVRNTTSPITGANLALAMLTGDNADSQQHNETRWFIDILDGTGGGENPDPEMDDPDNPSSDRKIVPDSGIHSQVTQVCGEESGYGDNASPYDGVQGGGNPDTPDAGYYDPDGGDDDGDGYSPDRERNMREVGRDVTVRDFPELFEEAQQPFEAVGIGMPWYSAFGNHDALIQGNSPEAYAGPLGPAPEAVNPIFDGLARGCLKPTKLPTGVSAADFAANPSAYIADSEPVVVPPDPRRCYQAKDQPNTGLSPCGPGGWIQEHSRTTGLPRGHGFEAFSTGDRKSPQTGAGRPPQARQNHDGYYSFSPRPGIRFAVLDTITDECGAPVCAEGSVDDAQYQWLEGQITAARAAREYVIVFSHHTLRTTRMASTDGTEAPIHYGERLDRKDRSSPQPVRPDAPPESTLEDLFCRSPNVVAHVNGHEHQNYVLPHNCEDGPPVQNGRNAFLEVSTAAHIDWPQQARTIELVRTAAGRLAVVLTVIDHSGPANPGEGQGPDQVQRLASIGREVSYNDYQGSRSAGGERDDRNVAVVTDKSWPPPVR